MLLELALLTAEGAPSDAAPLLQYGALGVITTILIMFARSAYKRETDRADAAAAEVARLNQLIQDKYVPALEASTVVQTETRDLLVGLLNKTPPPRRRT